MKNEDDLLLDIIRKEYHRETDFYITCDLPQDIKVRIKNNILNITYNKELFQEPFDRDNIFEAWMIIFYKWGIFDKIEMDWDEYESEYDADYVAIICRLKKFISNFSSWFNLSIKDTEKLDKTIYKEPDIKSIVESIVNITWYFETGNNISFTLPDSISVDIINGEIILRCIESLESTDKDSTENRTNQYSPIELILKRWTYLDCKFEGSLKKEVDLNSEGLYNELIKVGYTERELLFPTTR